MNFHQWAIRWQISPAAIKELIDAVGLDPEPPAMQPMPSEAWAQSAVRLEASQKGARLWRNNNGAFQNETGRWIRFGLGNDSEQLNRKIKSSDLIGIRPVPITQEMVGSTIGRFTCREIKAPGWRYTATEREIAQLNWINVINALGGDAAFATGPGTIT